MSQGFYGFPNILGVVRATAFKAVGKIGATAGAALAGGTTSGAPTSGGPFDVGDLIVSQSDGALWVCTVAGTSASSPGTFVQAALANPMTTSQDLIVGGSSGAPGRLAMGANGQVLSVSSSAVAWASPAGASLTTASATLGSDQTTTASWADVVTVSLAAGTWLLWAYADVVQVSGTTPTPAFRVTDGTTTYASAEFSLAVAGGASHVSCASEPVVLGATTTLKFQVILPSGSATIKASTVVQTQRAATGLRGLKVA